jgi:hypothetical protein
LAAAERKISINITQKEELIEGVDESQKKKSDKKY